MILTSTKIQEILRIPIKIDKGKGKGKKPRSTGHKHMAYVRKHRR
jgi:hypothetical protein